MDDRQNASCSILIGVLIAGAGNLFAQQPVIKVDVQQVLVPVVVTDKKGHHVSALKASDFRIFEDGVQQEITAFSSETAGSVDDVGALGRSASQASRSGGSRAARHTFVVCLDLLHTSPVNSARTRKALESLFEKEKTSDAQYVLIGIGRQLRVLQAATSNPLEILLKLRSPALQNAMAGPDASAHAAQLQAIRSRMDEFCKRCACGLRAGQNCDPEIDTLKQSVDADAQRWIAPTGELLDQFRSVVEELAKLPTGRTLILVSDGFDVDPRREFYQVVTAYLPNRPQFKLNDSTGPEPALQSALKVAAERNVVIYTIDSRGGDSPFPENAGPMDASAPSGNGSSVSMIGTNRTATPVRASPIESSAGPRISPIASEESPPMRQIAQASGGVYYHDGGELLKQFRAVLAEGREYYVLAYVPKNGTRDGRFRSISVETDKKLNIRAKPGYWAAAQ